MEIIKNTLDSSYLYGVPEIYFTGMEYEEAIRKKRDLANKRLKTLVEEPISKERNENIKACIKAVSHNDNLLKQIERDYKKQQKKCKCNTQFNSQFAEMFLDLQREILKE